VNKSAAEDASMPRLGRSPNAWHALPARLLHLPLAKLCLPRDVAEPLRAKGVRRFLDLCALPEADFEPGGWLGPERTAAIREAIDTALEAGLAAFGKRETPRARSWQELQRQLFAPLSTEETALLAAVLGIEMTPCTVATYAVRAGLAQDHAAAIAERVRARLRSDAAAPCDQLADEMRAELQAFDGLVEAKSLAAGTTLAAVARSSGQATLPLRLCAFLFPLDCTMHGGTLLGLSPKRCRRVIRLLHQRVTPGRLPLPLARLAEELAAEQADTPRGALAYLLRSELRIAVELDAEQGEVAVPDPRSPTRRLHDLLVEAGQPMAFDDLVYAYRERYRRANRSAIERRLLQDPTVLRLGKRLWSLRRRHEQELADVGVLADKAARKLCAEGGRRAIAELLADEHPDERTVHLVLARLADDPRVRLLGRGEACPATHNRSQVLERLLVDFRKAAGEVVETMFLANQPPTRRRLVRRLLHDNRLFVTPAENRVDTLSNYPLNDERLARLIALVKEHLDARTGYSTVTALKTALDKTDLGGAWLTCTLLEDLLRRNAPLEVLPGGLVAKRQLHLGETIARAARSALRQGGGSMSVDDMIRQRPELTEYAAYVAPLLIRDSTVHTTRGQYFTLL
jgi:hypothetical protein